jgi:hypothetical protein
MSLINDPEKCTSAPDRGTSARCESSINTPSLLAASRSQYHPYKKSFIGFRSGFSLERWTLNCRDENPRIRSDYPEFRYGYLQPSQKGAQLTWAAGFIKRGRARGGRRLGWLVYLGRTS